MGTIEEVMATFQRFQDGYTARDLSKLDEFMELFAPGDTAEMIGIGATERFHGRPQMREIIESDWKYWGDVVFDLPEARIQCHGGVAWLTTRGAVIQSQTHEQAMPFYWEQMKALLEDAEKDVETRMVEAAHYGIRRWRERFLGQGYRWPFMFTAILVKDTKAWRFHLIQWAMPVD